MTQLLVIHFDDGGNAGIVPTSHLLSYLASRWLRASWPATPDLFPVPQQTLDHGHPFGDQPTCRYHMCESLQDRIAE
jgi:hypothetical protein